MSALRADAVEASGVELHLRHPAPDQTYHAGHPAQPPQNGHLVDRIEAWSADGRRFGVSYAYPLLDPRCSGSRRRPRAACSCATEGRARFRQAIDGYLPAEVAWRRNKKDSFTQLRVTARDTWCALAVGPRAGRKDDRGRQRSWRDGRPGPSGRAGRLAPPAGATRPQGLLAQAPGIGVQLIVQLDAFRERNEIST